MELLRSAHSRAEAIPLPRGRFGPFEDALGLSERGVPGYLSLLGLQDHAAQPVIDSIERALTLEGAVQFVGPLFDEPNWRPHLVGAIALLLDDGRQLDARPLWRAIDAGSWVTPQLVVTALMFDRDIPRRIIERVERSCPVAPPPSLLPVERHIATGPANTIERSAKLLASLLAAGAEIPSLTLWMAATREEPTVVDLLQRDIDESPEIVAGWRRQLVEQFALRGRTLKPKAV